MCFISDGYTEFYEEKIYKARKEHKCEECRQPIVIGEHYIYGAGKFEGDFFTVKMCRRCEYLRTEISKIEVSRGCQYHESWPPSGELRESLKDYDLQLIPKDQVPSDFKMRAQ